jgi:hypothetical protein
MLNTLTLTAVASDATGLTPVARETVHADPSSRVTPDETSTCS